MFIELLVALVESESTMLRNDYPILEGIYNSTVQIFLVWTIDSIHSTILFRKAYSFFSLYLSRGSEMSVCNAFIRTRALENLADFYLESRKDQKRLCFDERANLEELIDLFDNFSVATRCPTFVYELRLITRWRFAKHLRE